MIQLWEKGIQHIEVIILKIQHDPFSCFMRIVLWFGFRDRIWLSFYHLSRWFFCFTNGQMAMSVSIVFPLLSNIGYMDRKKNGIVKAVTLFQWDVHPMTAITHITRHKRWADNVVIFNWNPLGFPGFFFGFLQVPSMPEFWYWTGPTAKWSPRMDGQPHSHSQKPSKAIKSHEFPVDFWKNLAIPFATDGDLVTDRWTDVASHDASRASRGSDWTAQISVNLEVEPLWMWKLRW